MCLEELWQLFPIVLVPHKSEWHMWATEEIHYLNKLLLSFKPQITHIGSTAISGIVAKPVIDLLVEIPSWADRLAIKNLMEVYGYLCMSNDGDRMSFNKGYHSTGYAEKVFHIHFHRYGDNDEIIFRDYLRTHKVEAEEYKKLKLSLLPKFKHNRDGYTDAKTDFIRSIVAKAKSRKISER